MGSDDGLQKKTENRLKSPWYIYMMCLNASLGIFFLGFNQGVFSVVQLIIVNQNGDTDDEEKKDLYSSLMSSFNPLGGLIGALLAPYVLAYFGKLRRSFIAVDILGIIGTIVILISDKYVPIIIARFIQGLAAGVNLSLVPIYIREFSPLEILGKTGSFAQLGQKGGLVIAYLMGLILPSKHSMKEGEENYGYKDDADWRIVLMVPMIFCIIRMFMITCVFRMDTPTDLIKQNEEEQLKELFHHIYNDAHFEDAYQQTLQKFHEKELKEIEDKKHNKGNNQESDHQHQPVKTHDDFDHHEDDKENVQMKKLAGGEQQQQENNKQVTLQGLDMKEIELENKTAHGEYDPNALTESQMIEKEEEFERIEKATYCRRTALGWIISLTVSFSGIDAIFYYSNKIFEDAGMEEYATLYSVCIGISTILFSFVGMAVVDSAGRRPLLLAGSIIMTVSLAGMVVADYVATNDKDKKKSEESEGLQDFCNYLILAMIILFMFGYNSTLGPIKWACYVELMNNFGVSVAASLIFVFAFVISLVFPFMVTGMKLYGAFSVFLGLSFCCFLYLLFEFKETKGLTKYDLYPLFLRNKPKKEKKKMYFAQNPAILEMHGISQINLSSRPIRRKIDAGDKKEAFQKMDLASIHKSYRESMYKKK